MSALDMTRRFKQFDFVVIGVYKCGTTSFYRMLRAVDEICLPDEVEKEVNIFADAETYKMGATSWGKYYSSNEGIFGNLHNEYFVDPNAPRRIYEHNPNAKLIVLIRDPIQRALSQYYFERSLGLERRSIDLLVNEELQLFLKTGGVKPGGLLDHGCYKRHIERFLQYFPRGQLRIIRLESLIADPDSTMTSCFKFLGVSAVPRNTPRLEVANEAKSPKSYLFSKFITYICRAPTRRTKNLVRMMLRPKGVVLIKRLFAKAVALNYKPKEAVELSEESRIRLQNFFDKENSRLDELLRTSE